MTGHPLRRLKLLHGAAASYRYTPNSTIFHPRSRHFSSQGQLREQSKSVAIFWDYENCPLKSSSCGLKVVNALRNVSRDYGHIKVFRAYLDVSQASKRHRSELHSSGVSLIDCPNNGRKDVADRTLIADMVHNPASSTTILITGDRDFARAIANLRHSGYEVVLISQNKSALDASLTSQASVCLDWNVDILDVKAASSSLDIKKSKIRVKTSVGVKVSKAKITPPPSSPPPHFVPLIKGLQLSAPSGLQGASWNSLATALNQKYGGPQLYKSANVKGYKQVDLHRFVSIHAGMNMRLRWDDLCI